MRQTSIRSYENEVCEEIQHLSYQRMPCNHQN